jgi:hypothetical protein
VGVDVLVAFSSEGGRFYTSKPFSQTVDKLPGLRKGLAPYWLPTPQEIAAFCVCAVRLLRVVSLDSRVQGARKDGRKGVKSIDIPGKETFVGVGWEKEICPRGSYFSGI